MIPDPSFWHRLADAADRETLAHFRDGAAVENKLREGFDPVTVADRAAERAIRGIIREAFPDDAILGEEMGAEDRPGGRRWVIDPIDGTRAFVAGIPVWTTLIGLEIDGRSVAGLVSQPCTGERFLAVDGTAKLYRADAVQPLRAGGGAPSDAIVMTVDPFLFDGEARDAFQAVRREARLVRYSADAYAFCAVAAGSVQVAFERGVQPYDVGALIPLVEAAGGLFTTWTGDRAEKGGDVVAAATPELHEWALSHLRPVASLR